MKTEELLQSAIYQIIIENPFVGALLQELTFKFDRTFVPTAAIGFNEKTLKYELYFNVDFFERLNKEQRVAVLIHEIMHFLHKHIFRWTSMKIDKKERMLWNIAADMAINQYIKNLPNGCNQCPPMGSQEHCQNEKCPGKCINVDDWKLKDGKPFPKFKTMENYYELIKENKEANKDKFKEGKNGDGEGVLDKHLWDQLSEEEQERVAREARDLIKRTIEKTQFSHSTVPGFVQDFMQELDKFLSKINYKKILQQAIKKTVMSQDRESSWKKPNKRYGTYAPGTSLSRIPNINIYVDTSGSISYRELNEFLDIIDEFLKAGNKKCKLALWHTQVYYNKKYKLKERLNNQDIQQGGTDPYPVLELIKKTSPDLSIILTDGYFDGSSIKIGSDIIWIISNGGQKDHAYKDLGKTIPLEGISK